MGGVFLVEHLTVVKLVIEKVAKYLLLPGLDLDVNLNIRVGGPALQCCLCLPIGYCPGRCGSSVSIILPAFGKPLS